MIHASREARVNEAAAKADLWFKPGRFAVLLAVCIFAAYPEVVLGARAFFFRDFGFFSYPLAYYHRQSFWRGEIPLWNPLSNCGIPFLAQWNTLTLYPGSLFYLLLPFTWSLGVFCLLHQLLAGVGMYFLAHRWTGNRLAAAVAGLAFAFNGLILNCLMWPSTMAALGWMPWVINSVELAWKTGGKRIYTASVLGALEMLSGGPEVILFTWGLLLVLWLAAPRKEQPAVADRLKRFSLMVLLVALICAVQLLPFLDLLKHSQRSAADLTSESSMPIWGWANLLVPLFHCYRSSAGVFFQDGQRWTSSYYIGIGTLALAALALFRVKHWRVRLLACTAIFGLVMALGEAGFLYTGLRHILPLVGTMNFPVKFTLLVTFVVPVLAAIALGEFSFRPLQNQASVARSARGIGLALVALLVTIVCISYLHSIEEGEWSAVWPNAIVRAVMLLLSLLSFQRILKESRPRQREWLGAGLLLVLWLDIYTHAPSQNPTVSSAVYDRDLQPVRKLDPIPSPGETRAMVSLAAMQKFSFHLLADPVAGYLGPRLGLHDNCNLLENIPKVDGFFPLHLREESEVRRRLYRATNAILERVADFMGVSQVTAEGKFFEWRSRTNFLPLVTAGQQPVFADDTATLSALIEPDFDPRYAVYLPLETKPLAARPARVIINHRKFANHAVQFSIDAPAPALVSVAQAYHHGWKAFVDGKPRQIWRANYAFQALEVPAGTHQVKLVYVDRGFRLGALISCSVLAAVIFGIAGRGCLGRSHH